jgi:hypothetical protein
MANISEQLDQKGLERQQKRDPKGERSETIGGVSGNTGGAMNGTMQSGGSAGGGFDLCVGDLVRVKERDAILATLDERGCLENLPFMPEMLQFCGHEFRVFKRADKTCDTIEKSGSRRMVNAVHLEDIRCDGAAHGGCQARCLIFWKEAWLERVDEGKQRSKAKSDPDGTQAHSSALTESQLLATTRSGNQAACEEEVYRCQATELRRATSPLSSWDLRQYIRDFRSGNVGICSLFSAFVFRSYQRLLKLPGLRVWLALYDGVQRLRGGVPFPYKQGCLTGKTPSERLGLQPGEVVQIKSFDEILLTLDKNNKNRGLWFDAEQVPHCGKTAKVLCRVEKIINERTGRMMKLSNDCLILEGVYCEGHYSSDRLFCPRSIYSYWREIWLKRIDP